MQAPFQYCPLESFQSVRHAINFSGLLSKYRIISQNYVISLLYFPVMIMSNFREINARDFGSASSPEVDHVCAAVRWKEEIVEVGIRFCQSVDLCIAL